MNYEKAYNNLILKRKVNVILQSECGHNHHIKPKRLYPELTNDASNIVRLTYKEHFIAHVLYANICKETYGINSWQYKVMHHVVYRMQHSKNYSFKINSRLYLKIEEEHRKIGPWNKGRHDLPPSWIAGKQHTLETRKKISEKCKGKKPSAEAIKKLSARMKGNLYGKGIIPSKETLVKRSASLSNRIRLNNGQYMKYVKADLLQKYLDLGWKIGMLALSDETKLKLSIANKGKIPANKGKKLSKLTRLKMSLAKKGKPPNNKGKLFKTKT